METIKSTAKTLIASVWLLFAAASVCSAKDWHGIVPLHSTCDDVKRILNVAECSSSFDTDEGRLYITYSKNRCADGWNVPPGTVLTISVTPKTAQRLDELGLDLPKYKREVSYDSPDYVFYSSEEEGVSITVTPDQKIASIHYYAEAKDRVLRYPESLAKKPAESNGDPQGTFKFDEYGDIKITEEHERLDLLVGQVKKEIETTIYIIVYAGRRAHVGEARARAHRIKDYLLKRGITKERIVTIDGGYRELLTVELFVKLKGGATPTATSTDCPGEVDPATDSRLSH